MGEIDWKDYQAVVIYGIGQYYETVKEDLFQERKPDYLCDRKWEKDGPESYDGIPVIKREQLAKLQKCLIIITAGASWMSNSIRKDLECLAGATVLDINDIMERPDKITGKMLKECNSHGIYEDSRGNRICFDGTIPDTVSIIFQGRKNSLKMGTDVIVGDLSIEFGNEGTCIIGDRTEIIGAYFAVSGAKVSIGEDSLVSTQVVIRNHDGHHIFDMETHRRINYPKDIIIEEHVWIGYRTVLLGGTRIGRDSIVGAGAVTSGQFGEHQVIAGCPAKVIREHVCWSKDDTGYFNRDCLEECVAPEV